MSSALSSELRTRFREYIEEGLSGRAAAARLKLSAATGVRWQRKWRETGAISPDVQGRPPGHGKLAAHQGLLEELVHRTVTSLCLNSQGPWRPPPALSPMPHRSDGFCASLGIPTKKVTVRDRTAARTGKTSAARMVQISHPQNAGASRSACIY
jgi:hypothetical protein